MYYYNINNTKLTGSTNKTLETLQAYRRQKQKYLITFTRNNNTYYEKAKVRTQTCIPTRGNPLYLYIYILGRIDSHQNRNKKQKMKTGWRRRYS